MELTLHIPGGLRFRCKAGFVCPQSAGKAVVKLLEDIHNMRGGYHFVMDAIKSLMEVDEVYVYVSGIVLFTLQYFIYRQTVILQNIFPGQKCESYLVL